MAGVEQNRYKTNNGCIKHLPQTGSTFRCKKILASINKSKIDLVTQPLLNAKRWLFGDDFPSIASKEAKLSHGLPNNLALKLDKSKTTYGSRDSRYCTVLFN